MLTFIADYARRNPGRVLFVILALHLTLWTTFPLLASRNLQLDLVEALALGKEWQLGYWKHPPLPWWAADIISRMFDDVRAVYLLGPLASVVAMWTVWRLGVQVSGSFGALLAVLALEGLHFFNFTAVKFNHDVLQLPFWALTGLHFFQAVTRRQRLDWILSGVWLALAFWTKYAAIVLAVPLGLILVFDPYARRSLRTAGPYLMGTTLLAVLGPHLWWLFESGFEPFRHAEARASVAQHWYQYATFPIRWIAGQAFFLAPVLALLAVVLVGARRIEPSSDAAIEFSRRYVAALAFGPFLFLTLSAVFTGRLPIGMWGYPLWSFMPLALVVWYPPVPPQRRLRLFAGVTMLLLALLPVSYAAVELLEPFFRDRAKATQFPGRLLADTVTQRWREETGQPLSYVIGADFGSSGASEFAANNVSVYSSDRPHVVVHGDLRLSPWIDAADLRERGAVMVWEQPAWAEEMPEQLLRNFPDAILKPPLVLPRQTLRQRPPVVVRYAILPPVATKSR